MPLLLTYAIIYAGHGCDIEISVMASTCIVRYRELLSARTFFVRGADRSGIKSFFMVSVKYDFTQCNFRACYSDASSLETFPRPRRLDSHSPFQEDGGRKVLLMVVY